MTKPTTKTMNLKRSAKKARLDQTLSERVDNFVIDHRRLAAGLNDQGKTIVKVLSRLDLLETDHKEKVYKLEDLTAGLKQAHEKIKKLEQALPERCEEVAPKHLLIWTQRKVDGVWVAQGVERMFTIRNYGGRWLVCDTYDGQILANAWSFKTAKDAAEDFNKDDQKEVKVEPTYVSEQPFTEDEIELLLSALATFKRRMTGRDYDERIDALISKINNL